MSEQFDSASLPVQPPSAVGFSGDACELLAATVKDYLESGVAPERIAEVTARLCCEAKQRGLSADETLAEIRATLGGILAACPLTSTDRAALVALAIDECVHAFYRNQVE